MSGYFHHGRHCAPSTTGRTVARAAVVGAAVLAPVAVATPASADTLDAIEQCESSGNLNASNGTHFGLYQFDLQTWRSVGGTGNPMNASRAEQRARAEALMAQRGTNPWLASKHCWGHGAAPKPAKKVAKPAPRRALSSPTPVRAPERHAAARPPGAPAHHPRPVTNARQRPAQPPVSGHMIVVRPGDTLSAIAAAHGESWRTLWARNRAAVANPNLIFPDQRITL